MGRVRRSSSALVWATAGFTAVFALPTPTHRQHHLEPITPLANAPIGPLPMHIEAATTTTLRPAVRLDPPAPPTTPPPLPGHTTWGRLALEAGWPIELWPWLDCVIWRESRGDPNALNINARTGDYSLGLTQLNTRGSLWSWFTAHGLTNREQLFDPFTNLHTARLLYLEFGRTPWGACP